MNAEKETSVRKMRRDKGTRLLTVRDREVLSWIAQQYAVRVDHVQILLSHRSRFQQASTKNLTLSSILQVINRWEEEPAWAGYRRIYVEQPGWVWVTPYGIEVLTPEGLPLYSRHALRESTLEHIHAINRVRLDYERRHQQGQYRWVSERTIRRELGRREEGDDLVHIPDAQLWLDGQQAIAIEVELSPKNEQDYEKIFDELLVSGILLPDGSTFVYRMVWYFVSTSTDVRVQAWRLVKRAQEKLPEDYRRRVQVIDLEKVFA